MAKCMIKRTGNFVDVDKATATQDDVVAPYTIVGQGSDNTKTGTVKNVSRNYELPINGTVFLDKGFYDGSTTVYQNKQYINAPSAANPGATEYVFPCKDKIVRGTFTLNGIENLTAENIRAGVVIGGVTGTFGGDWDIYKNGWKRPIKIISGASNFTYSSVYSDNGSYAEIAYTEGYPGEYESQFIFIDVSGWIPKACSAYINFRLTYADKYSWADDIDIRCALYRNNEIPSWGDNPQFPYRKEYENVQPGKSKTGTLALSVDTGTTGILISRSPFTSVRINSMYLSN